MARKSANQWFIAAMNGADANTVDIPLGFLDKGSWEATELFDAEGKPDGWNRKTGTATRTDHLKVHLSARGGFVGYFRK